MSLNHNVRFLLVGDFRLPSVLDTWAGTRPCRRLAARADGEQAQQRAHLQPRGSLRVDEPDEMPLEEALQTARRLFRAARRATWRNLLTVWHVLWTSRSKLSRNFRGMPCCRRNGLANAPFPLPIFCPADNIELARPGHLADLSFVDLKIGDAMPP